MNTRARLQSLALQARSLPGAPGLMSLIYKAGQVAFTRLCRRADRRLGGGSVAAAYLRRGGGRGELLPAASDLDFFVVLHPLSAEQEMEFLKFFWPRYRRLQRIFPFLGEVLMGDTAELLQWLKSPAARAYEARFSWKLLWGKEFRYETGVSSPGARDSFSEALKCYWTLLQPVLKLRPQEFHQEIASHSRGAVELRHGAKAALDLFRLHRSLTLKGKDQRLLWQATRRELLTLLPREIYGEELANLGNLLELRSPVLGRDPLDLFSSLAARAAALLHEMAVSLASENRQHWIPVHASPETTPPRDPYSLSVRELFAERMLFRHPLLDRALLSEHTAHMYFLMNRLPGREEFQSLLSDLRDVTFSFDRFSVAMPLTEAAYRELEQSSVLDTPFHPFQGQREIIRSGGSGFTARPYTNPPAALPRSALAKTFSELSFSLRMQPQELDHFLERQVGQVLNLRLASEEVELSADFSQALSRFGSRYPLRMEQLKSRIGPYLPEEAEESVWNEILDLAGSRAPLLKSQLEGLRWKNHQLPLSRSLPSDLWINLTPLLRMEMNTMKERFYDEKPPLRL